MEDYLASLYDCVVEQRLPHARSREDYFALMRREEAALDALTATFSPEQKDLYLNYEDLRSGLSSVRDELLFRETFALVRSLYAGCAGTVSP